MEVDLDVDGTKRRVRFTRSFAGSRARAVGTGLLGAAALCAAGCAGVDLERDGERVTLREPGQVAASCQKIGTVSARTLSRVVFRRSEEKIAAELATLARNEAGKLGGDTIAANSPVAEGKQSFDVFRCSVS